MTEHYFAVIMAGGGGTRLWPLSRKTRPKQMISLFDERSLFQTAVNRLEDVFPLERIYVVTVREQAQKLQEQCPGIPPENYLIEPMPRGTASVVGLAAVAINNIDPQAVMAILTADHFIKDEARFRQMLITANDVAKEGYLVTLGIRPTFPATGFGYVQRGDKIGTYRGLDVYQVKRFVEKPDEKKAREMLASDDYEWNSGMFFWRTDVILEEFKRQMPDLASSLEVIHRVWKHNDREATIKEIWPSVQPETIDFGIMEGAVNVAMLPASGLGWSDVGSWDSLFDLLEGDESGNIVIGGEHMGLDTSECLIYVKQEHRLIVTIGVNDLVLVDTGDVLLVCGKEQAQKVRQIVDQLKEEREDFV